LRDRSGSPSISRLAPNHSNIRITNNDEKIRSLNLVLSEKDSYINKLEKELNEIRLENEKIKDRLIVYELENLGKVN
jgi:hypothetical protein